MSDEVPAKPEFGLGVCRENLRRINQAKGAVDRAAAELQAAFSAWTNRKDADDLTSKASTEAQQAVDNLRKMLVDDHRIWQPRLQEAATIANAKRAATEAAKGST